MTDLITAAMIIGGLAMPPARYDHEPEEPYRIVIVEPDLIEEYCGSQPGLIVVGCAATWFGNTVVLNSLLDTEARKLVLRHELAHINGWSHPGQHGAFK